MHESGCYSRSLAIICWEGMHALLSTLPLWDADFLAQWTLEVQAALRLKSGVGFTASICGSFEQPVAKEITGKTPATPCTTLAYKASTATDPVTIIRHFLRKHPGGFSRVYISTTCFIVTSALQQTERGNVYDLWINILLVSFSNTTNQCLLKTFLYLLKKPFFCLPSVILLCVRDN